MTILVPTYRSINWILYAYARLLVKYWGEKFTIMAEEPFIDSNEEFNDRWEFIKPNFAESEIHGGEYHETLRWTLNELEDNFVTIMCADYLIHKPVDKERIQQTIEYMEANDNVLRANLGPNILSKTHSTKIEDYKDIEIYEGHFLPTSLTPGIWNRERLLELMAKMENSHTAWDLELRGRDALPKTGFRSIAIFPEPVEYINAIRGRNNEQIVITQEVYDEVKDLIPDNIKVPEGIVR